MLHIGYLHFANFKFLAGKQFEVHRYPGHHAFMNSDRKEVHDPAAAKQAWDRCLAFFKKHLA